MKIGRGIAWVLRRFAKPLETGSIPAPASKTSATYRLTSLRYVLGRRFGRWFARLRMPASPFWAGVYQEFYAVVRSRPHMSIYEENDRLMNRMMQLHSETVEAKTDALNLRDRLRKSQMELSALKRGKKDRTPDDEIEMTTMQRWSCDPHRADPLRKDDEGALVLLIDAKDAIREARDQALEDAAKVAESLAAQMADMVFDGLPEKARHREGMEATATRLAAAIRAMKGNTDGR